MLNLNRNTFLGYLVSFPFPPHHPQTCIPVWFAACENIRLCCCCWCCCRCCCCCGCCTQPTTCLVSRNNSWQLKVANESIFYWANTKLPEGTFLGVGCWFFIILVFALSASPRELWWLRFCCCCCCSCCCYGCCWCCEDIWKMIILRFPSLSSQADPNPIKIFLLKFTLCRNFIFLSCCQKSF